jgi:hypothetical protein
MVLSPNFKCYKTITDHCDLNKGYTYYDYDYYKLEPFEVFKLDNKEIKSRMIRPIFIIFIILIMICFKRIYIFGYIYICTISFYILMRIINNKNLNIFYNKLYYIISIEIIKKNKQKFLGGYLATSNFKTKNIDIYKIYSKDNFKLIHIIKIGYKSIHQIKYFYDTFHNIHYLTTLIDDQTNILIWKINNESEYELILNYNDKAYQGGYSMSLNPISFNFYMLMLDKEQSFLILIYINQVGCLSRYTKIEKYDLIHNKKMGKISFENYPYYDIYKGFSINLNGQQYLGILMIDEFILYNIFSSESFIKIKEIKNLKDHSCYEYINNGIIICENEEDKFMYFNHFKINEGKKDRNTIYKINLKENENLFKYDLNTNELISILDWNKKYFILFEKSSRYFYLLNIKTCKIENKFNNKDSDLYSGKKLVINDNEELLFIVDKNGVINIWIT